jgi:hypothetical protein
MLAFEKPISSKAVRPSGKIFWKSFGRLANGSALRKEIRLAALAAFGSICTASRRFADANWFGVNAKELKSVVITTSGAPVAGVMGVLIVRNSRVTD